MLLYILATRWQYRSHNCYEQIRLSRSKLIYFFTLNLKIKLTGTNSYKFTNAILYSVSNSEVNAHFSTLNISLLILWSVLKTQCTLICPFFIYLY